MISGRAPFKEWEPGGVEEVAAASGHLHLRVFAAVMHDAEKGEQLRPSAVALVHGVRVVLGVGAEPLEKPVDGVVADVKPGGAFGFRVGGDDAPVFGEEQENQPHEDIEQAGVNVVGVFLEDGAEQFAFGVLVGGLEAAQHFVKGVKDLAGQLVETALWYSRLRASRAGRRAVVGTAPAQHSPSSMWSAARMGRPATSTMYCTWKVMLPEFSPCGA